MCVCDCVCVCVNEVRASQLAQFSNTSFKTGLKTLPTFRPDALAFFRAKMCMCVCVCVCVCVCLYVCVSVCEAHGVWCA